MSEPVPLWLFNCQRCDDIQRIIEKPRSCECGTLSAQLDSNNQPALQGPGRLIRIPWEEYDAAEHGEKRPWIICTRD